MLLLVSDVLLILQRMTKACQQHGLVVSVCDVQTIIVFTHRTKCSMSQFIVAAKVLYLERQSVTQKIII